jgi:hypothetical protein
MVTRGDPTLPMLAVVIEASLNTTEAYMPICVVLLVIATVSDLPRVLFASVNWTVLLVSLLGVFFSQFQTSFTPYGI